MSVTPVLVTARPDGKPQIQGREVLRMWVETEPDRLVFTAVESDDSITPRVMPVGGTLTVLGANSTRIGTLVKTNGNGFHLK